MLNGVLDVNKSLLFNLDLIRAMLNSVLQDFYSLLDIEIHSIVLSLLEEFSWRGDEDQFLYFIFLKQFERISDYACGQRNGFIKLPNLLSKFLINFVFARIHVLLTASLSCRVHR